MPNCADAIVRLGLSYQSSKTCLLSNGLSNRRAESLDLAGDRGSCLCGRRTDALPDSEQTCACHDEVGHSKCGVVGLERALGKCAISGSEGRRGNFHHLAIERNVTRGCSGVLLCPSNGMELGDVVG